MSKKYLSQQHLQSSSSSSSQSSVSINKYQKQQSSNEQSFSQSSISQQDLNNINNNYHNNNQQSKHSIKINPCIICHHPNSHLMLWLRNNIYRKQSNFHGRHLKLTNHILSRKTHTQNYINYRQAMIRSNYMSILNELEYKDWRQIVSEIKNSIIKNLQNNNDMYGQKSHYDRLYIDCQEMLKYQQKRKQFKQYQKEQLLLLSTKNKNARISRATVSSGNNNMMKQQQVNNYNPYQPTHPFKLNSNNPLGLNNKNPLGLNSNNPQSSSQKLLQNSQLQSYYHFYPVDQKLTTKQQQYLTKTNPFFCNKNNNNTNNNTSQQQSSSIMLIQRLRNQLSIMITQIKEINDSTYPQFTSIRRDFNQPFIQYNKSKEEIKFRNKLAMNFSDVKIEEVTNRNRYYDQNNNYGDSQNNNIIGGDNNNVIYGDERKQRKQHQKKTKKKPTLTNNYNNKNNSNSQQQRMFTSPDLGNLNNEENNSYIQNKYAQMYGKLILNDVQGGKKIMKNNNSRKKFIANTNSNNGGSSNSNTTRSIIGSSGKGLKLSRDKLIGSGNSNNLSRGKINGSNYNNNLNYNKYSRLTTQHCTSNSQLIIPNTTATTSGSSKMITLNNNNNINNNNLLISTKKSKSKSKLKPHSSTTLVTISPRNHYNPSGNSNNKLSMVTSTSRNKLINNNTLSITKNDKSATKSNPMNNNKRLYKV